MVFGEIGACVHTLQVVLRDSSHVGECLTNVQERERKTACSEFLWVGHEHAPRKKGLNALHYTQVDVLPPAVGCLKCMKVVFRREQERTVLNQGSVWNIRGLGFVPNIHFVQSQGIVHTQASVAHVGPRLTLPTPDRHGCVQGCVP